MSTDSVLTIICDYVICGPTNHKVMIRTFVFSLPHLSRLLVDIKSSAISLDGTLGGIIREVKVILIHT